MSQKSNDIRFHPSITNEYSNALYSNGENIYENKCFHGVDHQNKENSRLFDLWPVVYASSTKNDWDRDDEKRWAKIFKRLDRNGNGRIDIQDLRAALKDSGMSRFYAEVSIF